MAVINVSGVLKENRASKLPTFLEVDARNLSKSVKIFIRVSKWYSYVKKNERNGTCGTFL